MILIASKISHADILSGTLSLERLSSELVLAHQKSFLLQFYLYTMALILNAVVLNYGMRQ